MKIFLVTLLLLIQKEIVAQDKVPSYNGTYGYHEVINVDSSSVRDSLFSRAKLYLIRNNRAPEEMIVLEDKSDGRLISKGMLSIQDIYDNFSYSVSYRWEVFYTKEIFIQKKQYEITLSNFIIKQFSKSTGQNNYLQSDLSLDQVINASQKGSAKNMYSRFLAKLSSTLTKEIKSIQSDISITKD